MPVQENAHLSFQKLDADLLKADKYELLLTDKQQLALAKCQLRFENEMYLRKHPEVQDILNFIMRRVLEEKPADKESIQRLFADELTSDDLKQRVQLYRSKSNESKRMMQEIASQHP